MKAARKLALGALVMAATAVVVTPAASDEASAGFSAVAVAEGGRLTFTVPSYAIVETIIDGGGPISQSVVDDFGSKSFASLPYPGDLGVAGPALLSAATGLPNLGTYPLYAAASYPANPSAQVKDPSGLYILDAKAGSHSAEGLAQFRGSGGDGNNGGSGGSRSYTTSSVKDGQVEVSAETVNEALNAGGGALKVASVVTKSVTRYTAGGAAPETKTEMTITGGSVGGYTFGYGPAGLIVAQQGIPLPAGASLDALNKALAPSGISLHIARAQPINGGAVSPALEIAFAQNSPADGIPGAVLTMRLGGATSSIQVGGLAAAPAPGGSAGGGGSGGLPIAGVDGPASGSEVGSVSAPAAVGGSPASVTTGFEGGPSVSPDAGAGVISTPAPDTLAGVQNAPAPNPANESAASLILSRPAPTAFATPASRLERFGENGITYLPLALTAVLLVGFGTLWRARGGLRI